VAGNESLCCGWPSRLLFLLRSGQILRTIFIDLDLSDASARKTLALFSSIII